MKDKISIILPVYNVEKYLNKCIDSILNQTYKNFELIIIDDGSTDNCPSICDEYKNIDNRIQVIHQKNKGLSVARNVGIDLSKGKYITFIDSDDYVDNKYIEILYNLIIKYNTDIVMCDRIKFNDNEIINYNPLDNHKVELITREEVYKRIFLCKNLSLCAWAKIYNMKIFKGKKIRYPKDKIYEDNYIFPKIIEECNKIVVTNYKGYFYRQREESITKKRFSLKRLDEVKSAEYILNHIYNNYPNIYEYAIYKYIRANYGALNCAIMSKGYKEEKKLIRKNILKYKKEIFKKKFYPKSKKFQTLLLLFGNIPYKLFYKIYKKGC